MSVYENISRRLGAVTLAYTDPTGGRWRVTVHWANVDGTAMPVGLDLHAYDGEGGDLRPTGGVLNAAVLRSLRIGELIEQSRRQGNWTTTTADGNTERPVEAEATAARRRGRPADRGDDFIAEVAGLYHEAKAQGGEPARKPWLYVADRLRAQGIPDVTEGQLKNWSRRAKNLGLLAATGRRRSTANNKTRKENE